jgi:outer membrane protein
MKSFSTYLNVILILAVAVLYYLHFTQKPKEAVKIRPSIAVKGDSSHPLIAYVDLDSLNEKIDYIKSNRKSMEAEQLSIESEWEAAYRGLESQKNEFLKKGASITQEQAESFQNMLLEKQQQVDNKKQVMLQKLNEKSYKFMDGIQKELQLFLDEYNESKAFTYIFTTGNGLDYMVYKDTTLNITKDVIEGMNDRYKSKTK